MNNRHTKLWREFIQDDDPAEVNMVALEVVASKFFPTATSNAVREFVEEYRVFWDLEPGVIYRSLSGLLTKRHPFTAGPLGFGYGFDVSADLVGSLAGFTNMDEVLNLMPAFGSAGAKFLIDRSEEFSYDQLVQCLCNPRATFTFQLSLWEFLLQHKDVNTSLAVRFVRSLRLDVTEDGDEGAIFTLGDDAVQGLLQSFVAVPRDLMVSLKDYPHLVCSLFGLLTAFDVDEVLFDQFTSLCHELVCVLEGCVGDCDDPSSPVSWFAAACGRDAFYIHLITMGFDTDRVSQAFADSCIALIDIIDMVDVDEGFLSASAVDLWGTVLGLADKCSSKMFANFLSRLNDDAVMAICKAGGWSFPGQHSEVFVQWVYAQEVLSEELICLIMEKLTYFSDDFLFNHLPMNVLFTEVQSFSSGLSLLFTQSVRRACIKFGVHAADVADKFMKDSSSPGVMLYELIKDTLSS